MKKINPTYRYELRDNIPLPDKAHKRHDDDTRWPFSIMEVGDSFDELDAGDFDRCRNKVSLFSYHHEPKKFATRVLQREGSMNCPVCQTCYPIPPQFILRVWRIK